MEFEIDLKGFERFVENSTKAEVSEKRRTLSQAINGDLFYPVKMWPKHMEFIFWKKPIGDKGTFKLLLFLVGNGCAPAVAAEWVLTSAAWNRESIRKRADQIKWIYDNMLKYDHHWFYYNIHFKIHMFLNGNKRLLK